MQIVGAGLCPCPVLLRECRVIERSISIDSSYTIARAATLSAPDRAASQRLIAACNQYEGLDLKVGFDPTPAHAQAADRADFFLAHQGNELVGYAALDRFGPQVECCGAVLPGHRRQGIGRALLDAARAEARRSNSDLVLICEEGSPSGQGFVQTLATTPRPKEYRMKLIAPPAVQVTDPALVTRLAQPDDAAAVAQVLAAAFGEPPADDLDKLRAEFADATHQSYIAQLGDQIAGYLRVFYSGDRAGIYGFGIAPEFRDRGLGRQMLTTVIARTLAEHAVAMYLEVETENARALHLYQSCGFATQTTYGYYVLADAGLA